MSIVSTNNIYNFDTLRLDLHYLIVKYPFLNLQIPGNSVIR